MFGGKGCKRPQSLIWFARKRTSAPAAPELVSSMARVKPETRSLKANPMRISSVQLTVTLALLCASCPIAADVKRGEAKAQLCLACHKSAYPWNPLLEGQPAAYLVKSMLAFKTGIRQEPAMNTNMASLTQQDMQDIAEYFATKSLPASAQSVDPAKAQAGRRIADQMNCASCHQVTYRGDSGVPRLAGQHHKYLQAQLEAFSHSRRKGHPGSLLPKEFQDIEALAHFLASLE